MDDDDDDDDDDDVIKEEVVAKFDVLFRNLFGETQKYMTSE